MNIPIVRFTNDKSGFSKTLRSRVDDYFAANKLNKSGGGPMLFKSLLMLSLYFVPWALFWLGCKAHDIDNPFVEERRTCAKKTCPRASVAMTGVYNSLK